MKNWIGILLVLALCLCGMALAEQPALTDETLCAMTNELAANEAVQADLTMAEAWIVFPEDNEPGDGHDAPWISQYFVDVMDAEGDMLFEAVFRPNGELMALSQPDFDQMGGGYYDVTELDSLLTGEEQKALQQEALAWIEQACPAIADRCGAATIANVQPAEGHTYYYIGFAPDLTTLFEGDDITAMVVVECMPELRIIFFNRNHGALFSNG